MDSTSTSDTSSVPTFSSLREKSLKVAGYGYLVGDAAIFAAGMMEKNIKGASVGLLWGLGGLAAARYGNPKTEKQLALLTQRLGDYLEKQGVAIPPIADAAALLHQESIAEHIEAFLYAHPSEALNAVYAIGAAQLLGSGMQKKFKADIASGALIGAGALAGLLVPEKKPDPSHPSHGTVSKALSWVQEKPLRLSGALYHINNVSMIWGAIAKRKQNPGQGSHYLRFATAASYIFANTMLSLSSRNTGPADHRSLEVLSRLAETSAQVVAAQPPEIQEALVQQISGYLSAQPEIKKTSQDIADLLHGKLASLGVPQAPSWQQRVNTPDASISPAL
jgi:hypothetical protein